MLKLLRSIGSYVLNILHGFGSVSLMGATVFYQAVTTLPRPKVLLPLMTDIGLRSLPVVLITGAFTGMVLAVQTYSQFAKLRVSNMIGAVVIVAVVKELGPVLTALILAGRVGSAMTAELGTMKVTDQIDALRSMGIDPVRHLIAPRFQICVVLLPLLTVYSDVIGILGGWLVSVKALGVDPYYYWYHAGLYTDTYDIVCGLIKGLFFGGVIALICCYKGFNCGQGAKGVGRATTEANVGSCIAVLVFNFLLAVIMLTIREVFLPATL